MKVADPLSAIPFGTDQYRSLQFENTTAENDVSAFGVSTGDMLTLAEYVSKE